ncbi:MAG: hypothetical protein IT370_21215 [Deltaproteobacteria bacterium]|nr:hypothetical protein [Deltaproteobacteria bacterium]
MWAGRQHWGILLTLAFACGALPGCSGGAGNSADAGPDASTTITIIRSINAVTLTEGDLGQRVSFHIDGPLSAPLLVSLALREPELGRVEPPELTFQPSNATTPQTVLVTAAHDDDGQNSVTRLLATAPGARGAEVDLYIADNDDQQVFLSPTSLTITEGQSATASMGLSLRPRGDLGITLTPNLPDKLSLTPATHIFTDTNFRTLVPITIQALDDPDTRDDVVDIAVVVSALGNAVTTQRVTILDDDRPSP